jgi:hypothetical protein
MDVKAVVEYIHNNPVRAGIVKRAEDYQYSSAEYYAEQEGLLEIIPVVLNWKTVRKNLLVTYSEGILDSIVKIFQFFIYLRKKK